MDTVYVLIGVVGIAAAAILAELYLRQRRELGRLARAVRACDSRDNGRLSVNVRSPEVVALADAVNALLDAEHQVRGADLAARRAFQDDLAALAHDVRTPLAGAQGYLELAEADSDPIARERYRAAARERLEVVRGLVEDLFEYTRLAAADENGAAQHELEPVVVLEVLEEALVAQYPAFAERGWQPRVVFDDEGLCALASRDDLARVFANLATNALRYGVAAPVVTQRGQRVVFSNAVENPGAVEVDRLFERFYRGGGLSGSRPGGGGLGLAIVKRLCDGMGVGVSASIEGNALSIELQLRCPVWPKSEVCDSAGVATG